MGKLRGPEYYDSMYSGSKEYSIHYKDSRYYVLWTQILQFIKRVGRPRILEIGCGPGQFAHYLYDEGFRDYHGFDFSTEAIEIARRTVQQSFALGDALSPDSHKHNYDVVVALEVLEHIEDDLSVVKNIKEGAYLAFSLPTSDDPAHVRWFTNPRQIVKRYYKCLDIKEIVRVGNWFACLGVVQRFDPSLLNRIFKTRDDVTARYIAKLIYRRIKRCLEG